MPATKRPNGTEPYGIVGGGRLARHFQRYLQLLKIKTFTWRRSAGTDIAAALEACPTILVLISDDAIGGFCQQHPWLRDRTVVHCSGSVVVPTVTGMHPLTSFGKQTYELETYQQIPFICEDNGLPFSAVFPRLSNPSMTIHPDQKPLYHCLCAMAGNFSHALWNRLFDGFEALGIPRSIALPYLTQISQNIASGERSLTGPVMRGDREVVARHLNALKGDPFYEVYMAFVMALHPPLAADLNRALQ